MSLGSLFKERLHPEPAQTRPPLQPTGKRASMYATLQMTDWGRDHVQWYLSKIQKGTARYESIAREVNVPWEVIAVIHCLECSCNFNQHLHNGDPLGSPTVRVPAGRPKGWQGGTWEESAKDALKYDKLDRVDWSNTESGLYAIERYNGMGYAKYHKEVHSPYLWSGSQYYHKGKYVSDGKFDANAVSKQMGAAVLLHCLGWHTN